MKNSAIAFLLLGAAQPALAQTVSSALNAGDHASDEILVTAQRRSESIQDVPLSITALSGSSLEHRGVTNFQDYAALVPNLSFSYASDSVGGSQSIALRGVFGRDTTGVYIDESPLPTSIDPRIVDLERIEVLRGPQGTLYGARSMGGTVRLITTQPDGTALAAAAHAAGSFTNQGGFNHQLDATLNVPIAGEALAVRISGFHDLDAGVFDRVPSALAPTIFSRRNNVDTIEKWGGSIAARAELADGRLILSPRIILQRGTFGGRPYADIRADNLVQSRAFDIAEPGSDDYELYTFTAQFDAGFGQFTSATSQFNRRTSDVEDVSEIGPALLGIPIVPAVISSTSRLGAFSQEMRFASNFGGPFQLTAGGFYQRQSTFTRIPPTAFLPYIPDVYSFFRTTTVTEWAAFAEATYALSEKISVTAGARLFDNRVNAVRTQAGVVNVPGTFTGAQKESGINPKFSIKYEANPGLTFYATAAKGFRTGGVNFLSVDFCAAGLAQLKLDPNKIGSYASDSLWSYEIGGKAQSSDRRLRLSGAAFQIDWNNLQQTIGIPICGFTAAVNAGRARNRGFELEGQAKLTDALSVVVGGGYTDAKIVDNGGVASIPNGSRVQQVPFWTFNASVSWDGKLGSLSTFANADYTYTGDSVSLFNDPVNPRKRAAASIVNGRLGVRIGKLEVAAFARNLFDENVNYTDVPPLGPELPGRPRIATNRPRTLGLDLRTRF